MSDDRCMVPDAVLTAFVEARGIAEARRTMGWRGRLRRKLRTLPRRLVAPMRDL